MATCKDEVTMFHGNSAWEGYVKFFASNQFAGDDDDEDIRRATLRYAGNTRVQLSEKNGAFRLEKRQFSGRINSIYLSPQAVEYFLLAQDKLEEQMGLLADLRYFFK